MARNQVKFNALLNRISTKNMRPADLNNGLLNLSNINITDKDLAHLVLAVQTSGAAIIKTLALNGEFITNAGLASVAKMSSLTDLNLVDLRITDTGLASITTMPSLTHLHLYELNRVTDTGLACIATMTSLTHLHLEKLHALTNSILASVSAMPGLTHLHLCGLGDMWKPSERVTDAGIISAVARISNLVHLHLENYQFADTTLSPIATMNSLTHLHLCKLDGVTHTGIASVARIPNLIHLHLEALGWGITNVVSKSGALTRIPPTQYPFADSSLACIATMPSLTHLYLCDLGGVTDIGITSIAEMPGLTDLYLRGKTYFFQPSDDVTDTSLACIATMPSLTHLYLENYQFTSAGIAAVAKMPNLTALYLEKLPNVTLTAKNLALSKVEVNVLRMQVLISKILPQDTSNTGADVTSEDTSAESIWTDYQVYSAVMRNLSGISAVIKNTFHHNPSALKMFQGGYEGDGESQSSIFRTLLLSHKALASHLAFVYHIISKDGLPIKCTQYSDTMDDGTTQRAYIAPIPKGIQGIIASFLGYYDIIHTVSAVVIDSAPRLGSLEWFQEQIECFRSKVSIDTAYGDDGDIFVAAATRIPGAVDTLLVRCQNKRESLIQAQKDSVAQGQTNPYAMGAHMMQQRDVQESYYNEQYKAAGCLMKILGDYMHSVESDA